MSRKVTAEEIDEREGWFAKLHERWFGDTVEEEEDEDAYTPPPTTSATNGRTARGKTTPNGTVLQVAAGRNSQISKRVPRTLEDAQRAAEDLKDRRPVIVNLEKADDELARRVVDFISGVTYALNGFYERVGDKVFLFTPSNIIIADEDQVSEGGKGLYADRVER